MTDAAEPSSLFKSAECGIPTTARFPATSASSRDGRPGELRHREPSADGASTPLRIVQAWLRSALRTILGTFSSAPLRLRLAVVPCNDKRAEPLACLECIS